MKLRFNRYLLLAWLPILGLHHAFFPQTTEVMVFSAAHARLRRTDESAHPMMVLLLLLRLRLPRIVLRVGKADCQTIAMKLSERQPASSMVLASVADAAAAAAAGSGLIMLMMPMLLLSSLATSPVKKTQIPPHAPCQPLGTFPNRFVVVNVPPSYAQAAGLIAPRCVKRGVAIGIAASRSAVVLLAAALSLFASVAIPLLREGAELAHASIRSVVWSWTNLRALQVDQSRSVLLLTD